MGNLVGMTMIPDNHSKSFLSKSYVNAVAAQAGFGCQFTDPDYGIDAEISEVQYTEENIYVNSGYQFNIQMKATHNFHKSTTDITYPLEADAYNRLIYHKGGFIVLVVFCIPQKVDDRLLVTEDYMQLRNCCYWFHVFGNLTKNVSSKNILIPRKQVFDPQSCLFLMDHVKTQDWRQNQCTLL